MAKGLASAGLTGLTDNIGKRANANREQQVLDGMVQSKEADDQKEQKAEMAEQAYYNQIRVEADKLLVGDRTAINNKAKFVQSEIKRKIKMFGGSHSKFMENGGLSMISSYSDQILNSPELGQYRANKENLAKIIALKKEGKGHLLTPQDQAALENYERDGVGEISYSGIMSDVEMPSANAFDYGYQMTPSDIYAWKDNKTKLMANWMLENPDAGTPTQRDIMTYITVKGYGGRGERMVPTGSKRGAGRNAKSDLQHTFAGSLFATTSPDNKISINDVSSDAFKMNDYLKATIGNKKWSKRGQENVTFLEGIAESIDNTFGTNINERDNGYALKGALQLPGGTEQALFKTANANNYTITDGHVIGFDPLHTASGGVYAASGENIDGGTAIDSDQFKKGDWKLMGAAMGWKTNADGKSVLIMDPMNEKGEIDESRDNNQISAEGNEMEAQAVMVNMLMKDGRYIYQEVPYTLQIQQKQLGEALGSVNDLEDVLSENREKGANMKQLKRADLLEKASKPKLKTADYEDTFTSNDVFNGQNRKYNVDPKGHLREPLRKSFYMAYQDLRSDSYDLDGAITRNDFDQLMEYLEIKDQHLRNAQLTDTQVVQLMNQQMKAKATTQQELDEADLITMKMSKYIEQYTKPNK